MDSFHPKDRGEWRSWFDENHLKKDFIWLIINKKKSQNPNLNWSEAVDEALCYGWIDSTKKSIDSEKYMQYFSKRKPKSNWSKINKDKVKDLIDKGLMNIAGLKSINIAKENGSWTFLDDVEALVIPVDLEKAFTHKEGSFDFFNSLSKSDKKILLYWIVSAKRKETRQNRILEIVENASRKLKPKQFR